MCCVSHRNVTRGRPRGMVGNSDHAKSEAAGVTISCSVAGTPPWHPRLGAKRVISSVTSIWPGATAKSPAQSGSHPIRIRSPCVRFLYSLVAEGPAQLIGCSGCWSGWLDAKPCKSTCYWVLLEVLLGLVPRLHRLRHWSSQIGLLTMLPAIEARPIIHKAVTIDPAARRGLFCPAQAGQRRRSRLTSPDAR